MSAITLSWPALARGLEPSRSLFVPLANTLQSLTDVLGSSDMSQVVYARVPDSLKEAVDLYAEQRRVTLTSSVVDLLERGLVAASDETSMTDLETKLAIASAEKAQVEANLTGAQNELGTLRAFAQRSLQPIGSCPNRTCGQPIRGYDLLALGHCPQCRQPLSGLLAPRKPNSLNEREVGVLLGALGGALMAVGAAVFGSSSAK